MFLVIILAVGVSLGYVIFVPRAQKTERALCKKEMQVALKMKVRQIGDLTRGYYIDPSVSPKNREAMERYVEQDDYEAGKALSFAEAHGNRIYIDLLTEKIKGNKGEEARLTRAIGERQKAKPSIQD